MKIAVINLSGNLGKSTVARHLLLPRMPISELTAIESLNADEGQGQALRGRRFGKPQEYLQTVSSVVVDIGASNVEDLMGQMQRCRGSQEDFDTFVVPTVPALKRQQDTIATLIDLRRRRFPTLRLKLVFNMVEDGLNVAGAFDPLLASLKQRSIARLNRNCKRGANEMYGRIKGIKTDLAKLAADSTEAPALGILREWLVRWAVQKGTA